MPEISVAPPATPEAKPVINREPKPLARGANRRLEQLRVVAANPLEQQIDTVARQISQDNPNLTASSAERARGAFDSVKNLLEERESIEVAIRKARSGAVAAPSREEFARKKAEIAKLQERQRVVGHDIQMFGSYFRDAGMQVDPSQIPLTASEKVRVGVIKAGEVVGAAGAKVGEVAKAGFEAGKGAVVSGMKVGGEVVAAGARVVESGVKAGGEAATAVATATAVAVQTGKEKITSGLEAGRTGLKIVAESGSRALKDARTSADVAWKGMVGSVVTLGAGIKAQGENAAGGIGRFFGGLAKGATENVSRAVSSTKDAAVAWKDQIGKEIGTKTSEVARGAREMLDQAKKGAGERINGYTSAMRSAGEAVRSGIESKGQQVLAFAGEQAARVSALEQQVVTRVVSEVQLGVRRGEVVLAPAWESIKEDRRRIREQSGLLSDKVGLLAESVADVAVPLLDKIKEDGQDVRDAAVGLTRRHIAGVQVFGREVAHQAREAVAPVWDGFSERWEQMRIRSNESRTRLNTFLTSVRGEVGSRFAPLQESATAGAKRAKEMLNGARVEGQKIIQNGLELPREAAQWFVHQGTAAREFVEQRREQIGDVMEKMRRYWEVYAVGKWQEMGLSRAEMENRLKLLRGIGAASLSRAAEQTTALAGEAAHVVQRGGSLGVAAGLEAGNFLFATKEGRVVLTAGAMILVAATHGQDISALLNHVGTSVVLPDLGIHLPFLDTVPVEASQGAGLPDLGTVAMPTHVDVGVGTLDPSQFAPSPDAGVPGTHVDAPSVRVASVAPDVAGGHAVSPTGTEAAVTPSHPVTVPENGVTGSIDTVVVTNTADVVTPGASGAVDMSSAHDVSTVSAPEAPVTVGVNAEILSKIELGKPIADQLRQLMPGMTDGEFYNTLLQTFQMHTDNFRETANAIVNGGGINDLARALGRQPTQSEIDAMLTAARTQQALLNDPSLLEKLSQMDIQSALKTLGEMMHYSHP